MEKEKEQVETTVTVPNGGKEKEVEETKTEVEKTEKPEAEEAEAVEETKAEETEAKAEEETEVEQPQVQQTEPFGNGIAIEELVTKDQLAERLSAIEAKLTAFVEENKSLKEQLSGMKDKYENKDFGNMQRKGLPEKDKYAESSFEEYSKQFM